MVDGERDPGPVIDGDRRHRAVLEAAVDEHQRHPGGRDLGQELVGRAVAVAAIKPSTWRARIVSRWRARVRRRCRC